MEAAKTGPSVQTITTDSKALRDEMDEGEVNVVALNADGTHEFRHANDAEIWRGCPRFAPLTRVVLQISSMICTRGNLPTPMRLALRARGSVTGGSRRKA